MKRCLGCMEQYDDSYEVCPSCGYIEGTPAKEAFHIPPGTVLKSRYLIGRVVGYGGFGVTYLCWDMVLKNRVAIKEYLPGEFSTRIPGQTNVTIYDGEREEQFISGIEKFMDEAKRLARFMNTPGIVHIYNSFLENNTAYIVMEYLEGMTLKEKLRNIVKMSLEDSLKIIYPVLSALKEVHEVGIIHRDIAPDNIFITNDGEVKLLDFGAARFATTSNSKSLSVIIKQGYAPQEQYTSRGDQGPWTDVYAVAATLYKMLTGVVPDDSMERAAHDSLKPPSKLGAKISKNIDTAIMNALNVRLEERTQSAEAFEQELLSENKVKRLLAKKNKHDIGKIPLGIKAVFGVLGITIITILLLFATGVFSIVRLSNWSQLVLSNNEIRIPNFINLTKEEAEKIARETGVEISIESGNYSDIVKENTVMSQNIKSGNIAENGTVVTLVLCKGEERITVPSLEGKTKEEASEILDTLGIMYEFNEVESIIQIGDVASQNIDADTAITKKTVISLDISKGISLIDTSKTLSMPDVTGMSYEDAKKIMEECLLYIKKEEFYSADYMKNAVAKQSVAAGKTVYAGNTIVLTVCKGMEIGIVPNVIADTENDAIAQMEQAGFIASISYVNDDSISKGRVINQSIEANSSVNKGTEIILTVSLGKKDTSWKTGTSLPSGVTNENYEIEEMLQYRYRDKEFTSSDKSNFSGWTLYDSVTSYGDYGEWQWSTEEPAASDTREVGSSKTQYQYQTATIQKKYSGWVDGNWQDTSMSTGDLCEQIGTRTLYPYYYFYCSNCGTGARSPFWNVTCNVCNKTIIQSSSGTVEWFENPWSNSSSWGSGKYYQNINGGMYWNWGDGAPITQYKYRTRTFTEETLWSEFSPWQDTQVVITSTQNVQTRKLFAYRDRTATTTYSYYRWGEWSAWSDIKPTTSDTREVDSRVVSYRYREK